MITEDGSPHNYPIYTRLEYSYQYFKIKRDNEFCAGPPVKMYFYTDNKANFTF